VIIGRQDLVLNEGWLAADGTPLDGSTTSFFDAAKLTYEFKDIQTTVEAIGIIQSADPNEWLPVINDQNRAVGDQDERGGILNINNATIKELNVGGYFIYKGDKALHNVVTRPAGTHGDDADIYTLGGRLSGLVNDHIKYSAEGAYQLGQRRDTTITDSVAADSDGYRDISAFGVNAKASYLIKDSLDNQPGFAYEFLSGDNKGTKNDEMFDVLWGRYPRWTDIYTYVYVKENNRIAQYNNYHRFGPTWSLKPFKKADLSLAYNVLFSDQNTPTRQADASAFTDKGYYRGQYLQSIFKYKFTQHISTLLQGEVFFPGNFYTSDKVMSFLRAEIMLTF
jgi:hypothetical protein